MHIIIIKYAKNIEKKRIKVYNYGRLNLKERMNLANMDHLKNYKHVHMIGIGGVSMSGIAEILKNWGFTVTGSDANYSPIIKKLQQSGIYARVGHDFENLSKSDVVVYSAAIKDSDPEMQKAHQLGIPTIERADFLGEITACFEDTLCISGTHGKTTTTSMVACCFLNANEDPSIQVGAELKEIEGNYKVGNSEYFILEACEYVESFLKFHPKAEVILNIDNDHLDYFKTFDNIKNAFVKYVNLLPKDGLLVLNADDPNCLDLRKHSAALSVTYGIDNQYANYRAMNISFNKNGFPTFDVYHNGNFYATFKLSVAGIHNVSNALACIALCDSYHLPKMNIKDGLATFTGANRRLEFKGSFNGASVFDDYAHHPTEIKATADSIKNKDFHESWVVFQPHTYSRTANLLDDFAKVLLCFDHVIITDIYAAREENTYHISAQDLSNKINSLGKKALYLSDFNNIAHYLKGHVHKDDIVITLGAGTITNLSEKLLD